MPPKTASTAGQGRRPRTRAAAAPPPAATESLPEAQGIRPPSEAVPGESSKRVTRSFHINAATLARFQAASVGSQARSYGTDIEVPGSLSAAADEALNLWSTLMENMFNDGKEFARVGRLSPGPSAEGARVGAEKRAKARAEAATQPPQ